MYDQSIVDALKGCNVLLVPVGGHYTIDAVTAKKYVDAINPQLVIPMHYAVPQGTIDIGMVDDFVDLFPMGTVVRADTDTIETDYIMDDDKQKVVVMDQYQD